TGGERSDGENTGGERSDGENTGGERSDGENDRAVDVLKQFVRDNLANYKVPRDIVVLDELPRNSTGKILRRELEDRIPG
ncbi:MAG: hypothetical protein HY997_22745, partial [Mycolicibacterium neoaurum]|nr:hypothetical protein [Mycolicibacterium neoaurum]